MKRILVLLFILFTSYLQSQPIIDTLSSTKSTINKTFQPAYSVKLTINQLDTNGAVAGGLPDSVYFTTTMRGVMSDSLGFRESKSDSLFIKAIFWSSKKRTGWVYLPGISNLTLAITNSSKTGRTLEFIIEPFYIKQ